MAALETTSFQGTTLRSMLLEAYAFGTIGTIALLASIVSLILAAVMIVLAAFGLAHVRRVPQDRELFAARVTAPQS